jgi:hypothetical protein
VSLDICESTLWMPRFLRHSHGIYVKRSAYDAIPVTVMGI